MQLLDQALLDAVQAKRIDPNDAYPSRHRQEDVRALRDRFGHPADAGSP